MVWPYLFTHAVTVLSVMASVLSAMHLFRSRRSSQSTLSWLLGFIFLPQVAVPLYLVFGRRKLLVERRQLAAADTKREDRGRAPPHDRPIEHVLFDAGIGDATADNSLEIFGDGVTAYEALVTLMKSAKKRLFVTMFILGKDETGRAFVALMSEIARRGVDVRLIVDALGSRSMIAHATRELTKAGGHVRVFMPLLHVPFRGAGNLRSHRKLVVVDGTAVFTGGMNLALEYLGSSPMKDRWRDLGAIARGGVATSAEQLFMSDWSYCGGDSDEGDALEEIVATTAGTARLQLVPSGPDRADDALYDALIVAIGRARKRVCIVTPYYIPDEPLQKAIALAARSGIETTLLMPSRSNHPLTDVARRPFLRELDAAGVRLVGYTRGMVHAKAMIVDDSFAYVGSPNMDVRSLLLNYEDAIFAYDAESVAKVDAFVTALLAESEKGALETKRRAWPIEPLARLLAPEL